MGSNSEIVIYQNPDGNIKIDVRLEDETVWLSQSHLCELFDKDKRTISEHIRNIFAEGELPPLLMKLQPCLFQSCLLWIWLDKYTSLKIFNF